MLCRPSQTSCPRLAVKFLLVGRAFIVASVLAFAAGLRAQVAQDPPPARVRLPTLNSFPHPPARVPIYYPPEPPPPGGESNRLAILQTVGWDAPAELAADVGEPFYAPLGSVLAEKTLTKKQRARLDEYRRRRQAALDALRAGLRQQPAAIPDQEEVLSKLEAEAEKLRHELISEENAWSYGRRWQVPDDTVDEKVARAREYHLLRAAAFYRDGLSPAHRRLLRDFVIALNRTDYRAEAFPPPLVGPGAILFFHPETAQIRLPLMLPPELAADFVTYSKTRHALQLELVRAILATDKMKFMERKRVFADLFVQHETQLRDLEEMAEKLRVALAGVPAPSIPPLPAELDDLARSLRGVRDRLHDDLAARLMAVRHERLRYQPGYETMKWETNWVPGAEVEVRDLNRMGPVELFGELRETPLQSTRFVETQRRLEAQMTAFAKENGAQLKEVETLEAQLIAASQRVFFPEQMAEPLTSDAALRVAKVLRFYEKQAMMPKYREYLTAVQQPGLSPAQRRLLFNAALVELKLPLPPGVRRPIYLYDSP